MERNDFRYFTGCFSGEKLNLKKKYVVENQSINHVFFLSRFLLGDSVTTSKGIAKMVLKEKQMTSEAENALSKGQSHISDELIAREYFESFCLNSNCLWTHPADPQIRLALSEGTVAFTASFPKGQGEAYQVLCDFAAQKAHFLSTNIVYPVTGRGALLATPAAVGHVCHTEDLQNLIGAISHYCGTPKRHRKQPRKTNLLSLLMGGGSGK